MLKLIYLGITNKNLNRRKKLSIVVKRRNKEGDFLKMRKNIKLWKKAVSSFLAASMVAGSLGGITVSAEGGTKKARSALEDSLELRLKFDGNLDDSSGHGINGTLYGSGTTYVDGMDGQAISLSGTSGNSYIDLGTSDTLQPSELTVSFWMKAPETLSGEHIIVWNKPSGNFAGDGWYLSCLDESTPLKLSVGQIGSYTLPVEAYVSGNRGTFFPTGEWVHVAVTYDSTTSETKIYRNGAAQTVSYVNANKQAIVANNTDHKYLGFNSPIYNGGYAKIILDDYEVYSSIATANEIKDIYEEYDPIIPVDPIEPEKTDEEIVNADIEKLLTGMNMYLTEDLDLPSSGENGSRITWSTTKPDTISESGEITRPGAGETDVTVNLTATVTYGEVTRTKQYQFTVLAYSDIEGMSEFSLDSVEVTDDYYTTVSEKDIEFLKEFNADRLLSRFRITAGLDTQGKNSYAGWESSRIGGHTMGHYLTACAQAYLTASNEEDRIWMKEQLEYLIDELLICQDAIGTGFIFGATIDDASNIEKQFDIIEGKASGGTWVPWYTMHKIIAGLVDVYKLVGDEDALEVASGLGNWVYNRSSQWNTATQNKVLSVEYGGMNDCLYELYKYSGNENHAAAAHKFDEETLFKAVEAGTANVLNGKHANTTIPKFLGALNRYRAMQETLGQEDLDQYLKYVEDFWAMVLERHTYITGGNSQWEHFRADNMLDAQRTQCNCETCNTNNMLKISRELFKITGEKKYSDYYETTFINAIMSSINPETGMTAYFQPMASGYFKVYCDPNIDTNQFWCCTGTGLENFTKLGDSVYFYKDNTLFVNQYLSTVLEWKENNIRLHQTTDIPESDSAEFVIDLLNGKTSATMDLRLRIPDWIAGLPTVKVNGSTVSASTKNGYVSISRTWKAGDKVSIQLPMKVVAYGLPDNNTVYGFKYGPIVLAAELGTDNNMTKTTCGVAVSIPANKRVGTETAKPGDGSRAVLGSETINIDGSTLSTFVSDIDNYLVRKEGSLEFELKETDAALTFSPYYQQHTQRYGIYWYFTGADSDSKSQQERILARKEEGRVNQSKIDVIKAGYGQYENDNIHNLQDIGTGSTGSTSDGDINGMTSRYANAGGSFTYRMIVNKEKINYLLCKLAKTDNGKTLKISVGNTVIYEQVLNYTGDEDVYEVRIEIPAAVVNGAERITVDDIATGTRKSYDVITMKFEGASGEVSARLVEELYMATSYNTNAYLTSLTANIGSVSEEEGKYTVTVPTSTTEVSLTAKLADTYGLLYVNDELVNDSMAQRFILENDTTTAVLKVYAEDHETFKEYSVVIQKSDEIKVKSITLSPAVKNLTLGESFNITASVLPSNAANKAVNYSSNNNVVSVSGSKVTAKTVGTAVITAVAQDGSGVKATMTVNVKSVARLDAPKSVKAVQKAAKIANVTWNKVSGARKYDVYRSNKSTAGFKKVKTVTTNSYTDNKATAGKTWYYKIVAVGTSATDTSAQSSAAKVSMLKAPSVSVKSPKKGQAVVSWKKISGAAGYEVYASAKKANGFKRKAVLTKANKISRTVKKLKSGKKCFFKVRAYKKVNGKKVYGAYSNVRNVRIK